MNRKVFLLLAICAGCLFSCGGKNNNPTPQSPIVGKWNLQQQHAVLYDNNVKIKDTVYNASAITYATAQFNQNGTFSSSSVYNPGNISQLNGPIPYTAKSTGTYTYTANALNMVPGLAGWFSFGSGSSTLPAGVTQSFKVTQLTTTSLSIHIENTFTVTIATGVQNYAETGDYYYSK